MDYRNKIIIRINDKILNGRMTNVMLSELMKTYETVLKELRVISTHYS